jgi:quinol monooxygenase YgiN
MSTIHLHQRTTLTPEQYVAGLTDFGPGRSKLFANYNSIRAIEARNTAAGPEDVRGLTRRGLLGAGLSIPMLAADDRKVSAATGKEQFALVGEIPSTAPSEAALRSSVDATTSGVPGLVHAAIHHRIDGQAVAIYEAHTGGRDSAWDHRRALQGQLENQRWYRVIARWVNQGGVRRVAFMRTFRVVSTEGAKDTVLEKLTKLVELVIREVPNLKLAIIHESLDRPDEIALYEEWDSTKEKFLAEEAPKPYRTAYRDETAHLIAERGDLEWLSPIRIYESETPLAG